MTFWSSSTLRAGLMALACIWLSGCLPSGQGQLDEENESHYLAGKQRGRALDYKGAIECFEQSLKVNPDSAPAHLELGVLFDQREPDPAAAIYHYRSYLKLMPNASNADGIRSRILACTEALARTVSLGPVTQTLQAEFEKLADENKRLVDETRRQKEELEKWRAYYVSVQAARAAAASNQATALVSTGAVIRTTSTSESPVTLGGGASSQKPASGGRSSDTSTVTRTHIMRSGETLASVAHQYGVRLDALKAANLRLEPRRIKAGQVIIIPAR